MGAGPREQLEAYAREVALRSAQMHLVGKGDIEKNIALQLLDSLLILDVAERNGLLSPAGTDGEGGEPRAAGEPRKPLRVADIGSGAGFPGIVWKILRPEIELVLFERKERLHGFLERVIAMLSLEGASAEAGDAGAPSRAGSFELAVSKAAGRLPLLLPIAEGLLAPGRPYITIKGSTWRDELTLAGRSSMRLERAAELPHRRGFALVLRKA